MAHKKVIIKGMFQIVGKRYDLATRYRGQLKKVNNYLKSKQFKNKTEATKYINQFLPEDSWTWKF